MLMISKKDIDRVLDDFKKDSDVALDMWNRRADEALAEFNKGNPTPMLDYIEKGMLFLDAMAMAFYISRNSNR